jgi:DNA-binding MarR family transcriptional regulator
MAEFRQALAHHALRQELRNEKRDMIRLGRSRICHLDRDRILETAVITILALRRIDAAGRDDAVEDAQILENLLTARLDTLAARSAEGAVQLLDDAEGDVTARKLDSEREPGRPCAAYQDIDVEYFGHGNLGYCVYYTHIIEARMASRKKVHNTHIVEDARKIYGAVVDLVGLMNRPLRDARMIEEAGISLDRALFPLLVGVGRFGPIGVGELADRAGRDYTTISRQVAKLETLGLVKRRTAQADRRVSEAVITTKGRAMTQAIDKARDRLLSRMLAGWSAKDTATLAELLRRLADDALAF